MRGFETIINQNENNSIQISKMQIKTKVTKIKLNMIYMEIDT